MLLKIHEQWWSNFGLFSFPLFSQGVENWKAEGGKRWNCRSPGLFYNGTRSSWLGHGRNVRWFLFAWTLCVWIYDRYWANINNKHARVFMGLKRCLSRQSLKIVWIWDFSCQPLQNLVELHVVSVTSVAECWS